MILNKTLDFNDLKEPGASNMINWFEDKYKKIAEQKIPVRKDGRDNFNRRYWEYFFTTHKTPVEIDPPSRILDIGCGGSIFTYYLREYYNPCYVLGIDYAESCVSTNIAQASIFPKKVDFIKTRIQDFNPTELFDAIFSISVIEHDPQDKDFIEKCAKILTKGGTCTITFDYHKNRPYVPGGRNYNQRGIKTIVDHAKKFGMELWANKVFYDNTDYENGLPGIPYTFGSLFFHKII